VWARWWWSGRPGANPRAGFRACRTRRSGTAARIAGVDGSVGGRRRAFGGGGCWPTAEPTPKAPSGHPVDMITGPGNIYVTVPTLCARESASTAEAGPTEIAILADNTAHPAHVARRFDQPGRRNTTNKPPACW